MVWHQNGAMNQKRFICALGSASFGVSSDNLLDRTGHVCRVHRPHATLRGRRRGSREASGGSSIQPAYNDGSRSKPLGPSASQHKNWLYKTGQGTRALWKFRSHNKAAKCTKRSKIFKLNLMLLLLSRLASLTYNEATAFGCPVSISNTGGKH